MYHCDRCQVLFVEQESGNTQEEEEEGEEVREIFVPPGRGFCVVVYVTAGEGNPIITSGIKGKQIRNFQVTFRMLIIIIISMY